MKLVGAVAVAAIVVAAVVTTYARSSGVTVERPEAAPAAPTQSPRPPQTGKLDVDPGSVGPAGLNVRYLDEDGEIKDLGVQDFPR
ncbi:MAG TPA: hypothetical protein VF635_11020 [Propionibacteriaceae bacterium]|jgi:hypothetical protein